jgi:hypothetical protein
VFGCGEERHLVRGKLYMIWEEPIRKRDRSGEIWRSADGMKGEPRDRPLVKVSSYSLTFLSSFPPPLLLSQSTQFFDLLLSRIAQLQKINSIFETAVGTRPLSSNTEERRTDKVVQSPVGEFHGPKLFQKTSRLAAM